jgi:hypothetical protein
MSLVSLAKKAKYGQELESLNTQIINHITQMAGIFRRFTAIKNEIENIADFTEEDKAEIQEYITQCYTILMYAAAGGSPDPTVDGVPIELWDSIGIDVRSFLQSIGKYSPPDDSTSSIIIT